MLPAQPEEPSHLVWLSVNLDHEKVANGVLSRSRYINSEAAQIYDQYIDEGDYSRIVIMQDDGIHANLRYTQQAYVATVIKVTHVTFVQFPDS